MLLSIALLLVGGLFGAGSVLRGRSRGYDATVITTVLLGAMLMSGALPAGVAWQAGYMGRRSSTTDLFPIVVVVLSVAAAAVAGVATWVIVRGLPKRLNRRPGMRRRRHRYWAWSYVVAVLTMAATAWAWLHVTVETAIRIPFVGLTAVLGLRRLERRHSTQVRRFPQACRATSSTCDRSSPSTARSSECLAAGPNSLARACGAT